MIRQDGKHLKNVSKLPFKVYACALFDIIYYAVMHGNYQFDYTTFLEDVDAWINAGVLDKELTILSWDRLCRDAGLPYRLVIEGGTHKLPASRVLQEGELQILYLYNPSTNLHHFVCANFKDDITYDSLGESVTGKAYKDGHGIIASRRVFRKI